MTAPRWHLPTDRALCWREWDGQYVVYSGLTGDTHLLDPAAARVLLSLPAEPSTLAEIQAALGRLPQEPGEPPYSAAWLEQVLATFLDMGLVRQTIPE